MTKRLFGGLLLLLLIFNTEFGAAQTTPSLEFLTIGSSTKQLAMNEATTAMPIDGLNALVNPATIAGIKQSMMSASYTIWGVPDTKITSFSTVLKEGNQTLALGLLSNSTGNIETRNTPGAPLSSVNVDYLNLNLAYAYDFTILSIGVNASYISEQYIVNNASGFGFGIGIYSSLFHDKVRLGASINHVGEMSNLNAKASKLPTQARAGIDADLFSVSIPGDLSFPIMFSATTDYIRYVQPLDLSQSYVKIIQNEQTLLTSLRLHVADLITFSGGMRFLDETNRSWTMGLGIYKGDFKFDFAFIPFETGFNTGYSIGMMYQF